MTYKLLSFWLCHLSKQECCSLKSCKHNLVQNVIWDKLNIYEKLHFRQEAMFCSFTLEERWLFILEFWRVALSKETSREVRMVWVNKQDVPGEILHKEQRWESVIADGERTNGRVSLLEVGVWINQTTMTAAEMWRMTMMRNP